MQPLAHRIRPVGLESFIGQGHLVGEGKPLRVAIETRTPMSFVLWGPPGTGKTTLARIYARSLDAELHELSAVSANKADITKIVQSENSGKRKVLFLDEIHRFNKAQQDYLLPFVEDGTLILIGATTENPSFEVNGALLSRVRVFVLEAFSDEAMEELVLRAAPDVNTDAREWLVRYAAGDARRALTAIEGTISLYDTITVKHLTEAIQSKHLRFDKKGDTHYDTISAFIKSMRASQKDAAMYYLARLVAGGEDPLFIARRMIIFASEDIGLAQPTALVVANAVFEACRGIGYPECAINLAHGVSYLSDAKKDRSSYEALRAAQQDVRQYGELDIPHKIRNAPTKLMKDLEYGNGYNMYDSESYLPEKIKKTKYF
jgi:putative ATPase